MSEPSIGQEEPTEDDVVHISGTDFRHMMEALDAAGDDVRAIVSALGLGDHARDYTPHEVVHREVLPSIKALKETQAAVDSATKSLQQRAELLGNKTIELPNGDKAVLVGRRLPKGFLK